MTFVIPPQVLTQRGEPPSAAAISTQVWSDKEAIATWELQPWIQQDRNPPVQNTVYDLIDITGGCMVMTVYGKQSNGETDVKEIDWIYTVDGEVYLYDGSVTGGMTNNDERMIPLYDVGVEITPSLIGNSALGFLMEKTDRSTTPLRGKDIKIQYRMTSAAGTAQRIYTNCLYATLELI